MSRLRFPSWPCIAAVLALAPGVVAGDVTASALGETPPAATASLGLLPLEDADGDGVADASDNCPDVVNPAQADLDEDGFGDACDGFPGLALWVEADGGAAWEIVGNALRMTFRLLDRDASVRSDLEGIRVRLGLDGPGVFGATPIEGLVHEGGGTAAVIAEFVEGVLVLDVVDTGPGEIRPSLVDHEGHGLRLVEDLVATFEHGDDGFRDEPVDGVPSPRPWVRAVPTGPYDVPEEDPTAWLTSPDGSAPFATSRLVSPWFLVPDERSVVVTYRYQGNFTTLVVDVRIADSQWLWLTSTPTFGFDVRENGRWLTPAGAVRLGFREPLGRATAVHAVRVAGLTERLRFLTADGDEDGDALNNATERDLGTDPFDPDTDGDGVDDGVDNCPLDRNSQQLDDVHPNGIGDSCDDPDGDGVVDFHEWFGFRDNCPDTPNPAQADDVTPNGVGDACDDPDGDGLADADDVCPHAPDPAQTDRDGDSIGDACDACPDARSDRETAGGFCPAFADDGGQCLEIDLAPAPRSFEVVRLERRVPTELTLTLLTDSCRPEYELVDVLLNDVAVGRFLLGADDFPFGSCQNFPRLPTVVVDPSLLTEVWRTDGPNRIRLTHDDDIRPRLAWLVAELAGDGASERMCLWDPDGGACLDTSVRYAAVHPAPADALELPPTFVARVDPQDLDAQGAGLIDATGLVDGEYLACGAGALDGLVGLTRSGLLLHYDTVTGRARPILDVVADSPLSSGGLAFDPATRRLFGRVNGTFALLDTLRGTHEVQQHLWWFRDGYFEIAAGAFWYWEPTTRSLSRWSLPPDAQLEFSASQFGEPIVTALAQEPTSGALFATGRTSQSAPPIVFRFEIDEAAGTATAVDVITTDVPTSGAAFGPGGTLYGVGSSWWAGELVAIDASSGISRIVGPSGFDEIGGLVWVDDLPVLDCFPFTKQGEEDIAINDAPCGPPTADAGPDRVVECSSPTGTPVTLDGSGSFDPNSTPGTDDDIVAYEWSEAGAALATGVTPTVTLDPGVHAVDLTVTDTFDTSGSDRAVITVSDSLPPSLTCPDPIEVTVCLVDGLAEVDPPSAVAQDTCAGAIEVSPGALWLPVGTTPVSYEAVDPAGNAASCAVEVTVTDPPVVQAKLISSDRTGRGERLVRLTNVGGTPLAWTASGTGGAVLPRPSSGTLAPGESVVLSVSIRYGGLTVAPAPTLSVGSNDPCRPTVDVVLTAPAIAGELGSLPDAEPRGVPGLPER